MDFHTPSHLFPIRELVSRTGVNASTLRAWENRHGLITPVRAPSGHRLYSADDVARVQRVQELLEQGFSLPNVVARMDEETSSSRGESAPRDASNAGSAWSRHIDDILRALEDFSTERLDHVYGETCALYPIEQVTANLLIPVLEALGLRWDKRVSGIAEEHFFSAWLRNKLGARLHHASGLNRGKRLILACLPGEQHEIGLLIFALNVLQAGHRMVYLGASMPIRQIIHVADKTAAAGIILAGRPVSPAEAILADVAWLCRQSAAPVFVGSHFSMQNEAKLEAAGAIPLGTHIPLALHIMDTRLKTKGVPDQSS